VIDATIDHDGAFLQSRESSNIYSTDEPQVQFNERIHFCFKIYQDALKVFFKYSTVFWLFIINLYSFFIFSLLTIVNEIS